MRPGGGGRSNLRLAGWQRAAVGAGRAAVLAWGGLAWSGFTAPSAWAQGAGAGAATVAPTAAAAPFDAEAAQAGRRLYGRHCTHCHGFNMVNPGTVSFDLRKFPKDDPQRFFQSVKEGKNTMPAWKQSLSDDEIRQVWAYVLTGGKP